jgi:hypothetical protein
MDVWELVNVARQLGIVASVFGGSHDLERSAYDRHMITAQEYSCALPYRFPGRPPRVRIWRKDKSVDCQVADVGPWNIKDPYWRMNLRPQAESGRDRFGRKTDRAGIDISIAAAKVLGLNGLGLVDWEFLND